MKRTIIFALALGLFLMSGTARAETAAAQFTFTKKMTGIPGGGSGTVTFRVDPARKTFTCSLTGTGKLSGTATVYNVPQRITATLNLSSTSCSGKYFPDQGTIDGTLTVSGTYHSTATYRSTSGETLSESNSGTESGSGTIYGNLGPGGRGVIDLGDGAMNFSVTRPLSAGPAQAPPQVSPAQPSRPAAPAPPAPAVRPVPARPTPAAPPVRPAPSRPQPGAVEASRPEPERPEPSEPTEPEAPADDGPTEQAPPAAPAAEGDEAGVVDEYIRDSMELTNTVMDEFKEYQSGGGRLNLSTYLRDQYPDPAEREKVETAIRVAAEEKELRQAQLDTLMRSVDSSAGEIIGRYNAESVAPAAAGRGPAESLPQYLARVVTDPEERTRLQESVILSTVNSYERAREAYGTVVDKLSRATDRVKAIWNSATTGPNDTRENWLRQQAADLAQGRVFERLRQMVPESIVETYDTFAGWKENYDSAVAVKETGESLQAKNKQVMDQFREGKLAAEGVAALRGLNVLQAGLEALPAPKGLGTYKDVMVGDEGLGRVVKATNDVIVYKSSVRNLSPDVSDAQIQRFEESRKALTVYGEGKSHKPYNDENAFVTILKSLNPFARPETKPEHKKYH